MDSPVVPSVVVGRRSVGGGLAPIPGGVRAGNRHGESPVSGVDEVAEGVGPQRVADLTVGGPVLPRDESPRPDERVLIIHAILGRLSRSWLRLKARPDLGANSLTYRLLGDQTRASLGGRVGACPA